MSPPTSLAESRLKIQAGLAAIDADPPAHFKFGVQRIAQALARLTGPRGKSELLMRGPNVSGKSLTAATWTIECLKKRRSLDGCPLPQWRGPVEAIQAVLDNPTQLLSVQPAYERMLGKWPHHANRNGPYLSALHVMPEGGDPNDTSEWSVLYFRTLEGRNTGIGARADIVIFDEPPPMAALQELRKASHAGREGKILIPMTPTLRRQWAPIRDDYGDTPRSCIRDVDEDRMEVRWSMDEVADFVLSPAEKARLWRKYQNDPLFGKDGGARWHGDYENTEGASPWGPQGLAILEQWLREYREHDPEAMLRDPRMVRCKVQRENRDGEPVTTDVADVEIYTDARRGRDYRITIDPASGVDDGKHNPLCLQVAEVGSGDLMARWNGYLAPFQVGVLAAGLARMRYNGAEIDIEMKDHWGVNVFNGVTAINGGNYWNLAREKRETRPGVWTPEIGFDQNEESKAAIVGAIQEWLRARAAGIKYADCPSRAVVKFLIDCELDENGRVVYEVGIDHAEDVICFGQNLRRGVTRSGLQGAETAEYHGTLSDQAERIAMAEALRMDEPEEWGIMRAPERGAL